MESSLQKIVHSMIITGIVQGPYPCPSTRSVSSDSQAQRWIYVNMQQLIKQQILPSEVTFKRKERNLYASTSENPYERPNLVKLI